MPGVRRATVHPQVIIVGDASKEKVAAARDAAINLRLLQPYKHHKAAPFKKDPEKGPYSLENYSIKPNNMWLVPR